MHEPGETDVRAYIDLYTTIWSVFRTRPFTREKLARRLRERGESRFVDEETDLESSLARLVDYGLLEEPQERDGYRIAVRPDAVAEELPEAATVRTEAVHQLVQSSLAADSSDDHRESTLSYDDESYAVVELERDEEVTAGVERVVDAAERSDHRGVVVTTPGTNADRAQRIADRLVDESGHGRWEKAGSNVVKGETNDDELVFRLYLDSLSNE